MANKFAKSRIFYWSPPLPNKKIPKLNTGCTDVNFLNTHCECLAISWLPIGYKYTDFGIDERICSHSPRGYHFLANLGLIRPFFRKTRAVVRRYLVACSGVTVKHLYVMHNTPTIFFDDWLELNR